MTHRIDRSGKRAGAAMSRTRAEAVATDLSVPVVVVVSTALVVSSLVLTILALTGVANGVPAGARAAVVCLVAMTLPGLPVAALLKLPHNGVFGSVAIGVSMSSNVVLAQANYTLGPHLPFLVQFALIAIAVVAIALLERQRRAHSDQSLRAALSYVTVNRMTRPRAVSLGLLALVVMLFGVAVWRLDTDSAEAYGLLQILGVEYFVGLLILGAVLAVEYCRPAIDRVMVAAANVVLIMYVTMPVAWADRTAPFSTAYVHSSITDWIAELAALPPPLDARISWAGFFSGAAQLMTSAGLSRSTVFVVDASLVFGILMIFPLYAIGLAISDNPRAAWLGVTVYVLFNWYQQDYFAPQAFAMQLYATLIAVLLWELRAAPIPNVSGSRLTRVATTWMRIPGRVAGRGAGWTLAMELAMVLLLAAQVVSHQLTPIATISALILFAALGVTRHKVLWVAAVLLFMAWFTFGASDFWEGHLGDIITDIGGVDANLSASVTERPATDPVYGRMQMLRIAASLLLIALAGIGWLRMPKGALRPIVAALAIAPFGIVLVQSYGGEVAIRCFLYASPVLAPLAALVLLRLVELRADTVRRFWIRAVSVTVVFFTLGVWVVTDRGLNTSFEHSTPEEVAISEQFVAQVDASRIASWGQGASLGIQPPFLMQDHCYADSKALVDCVALPDIDYFVDSNQDRKYLQYQHGVSNDQVDQGIEILLEERGFEVAYAGRDIRILQRVGTPRLRFEE